MGGFSNPNLTHLQPFRAQTESWQDLFAIETFRLVYWKRRIHDNLLLYFENPLDYLYLMVYEQWWTRMNNDEQICRLRCDSTCLQPSLSGGSGSREILGNCLAVCRTGGGACPRNETDLEASWENQGKTLRSSTRNLWHVEMIWFTVTVHLFGCGWSLWASKDTISGMNDDKWWWAIIKYDYRMGYLQYQHLPTN